MWFERRGLNALTRRLAGIHGKTACHRMAFGLLEDSKGTLWIGTAAAKLFRAPGFKLLLPDRTGMGGNLGLAEDRNGSLWILASSTYYA